VHVEESADNISRALKVVFVAKGVPSLGYKTFYLTGTDKAEELEATAKIALDRDNDRKESRRSLGFDTLENGFYKVSIDRATGRVTLFDKALGRDAARDLEIVALEERGGNYIGIEPLSGRSFPGTVEEIRIQENNPVRAVAVIVTEVAGIRVEQKLTLYRELKRMDIENTAGWQAPKFVRLQQVIGLAQAGAPLHYGVPFGSNSAANLMPNSGPRAVDEIKRDSWLSSRHIHDWIHAGSAEWGLTVASDHQQVRLGDGLIRMEMLRGTRYTSVKVVRGDEVTSMFYPPPGRYVFRYSLSSGAGDWRSLKAYRAGKGLTNPLIGVEVADRISAKTLPPEQSFLSLGSENLVLSALKKSDLDNSLLVRVYEMEGLPAESSLRLLGSVASFGETNLLEEDVPGASKEVLKAGPYAIRTLKVPVRK
jgi:alpha-mannosidase